MADLRDSYLTDLRDIYRDKGNYAIQKGMPLPKCQTERSYICTYWPDEVYERYSEIDYAGPYDSLQTSSIIS